MWVKCRMPASVAKIQPTRISRAGNLDEWSSRYIVQHVTGHREVLFHCKYGRSGNHEVWAVDHVSVE